MIIVMGKMSQYIYYIINIISGLVNSLFFLCDKKQEANYIRVTKKDTELVNENIPNVEMLVIDDQGNNLGKMNKARALKEAEDRNLDLVVVSPDSKVVVAKMMDYSKHRYEQQKKLREMKKNQQTVDIKEIRLSPIIGVHDFNTKLNHAKKFISKGDKVKLTLRFRGRMIQHKELGAEIVDKFISELGESIIIESKPKLEGFQIIAVIAPNNN